MACPGGSCSRKTAPTSQAAPNPYQAPMMQPIANYSGNPQSFAQLSGIGSTTPSNTLAQTSNPGGQGQMGQSALNQIGQQPDDRNFLRRVWEDYVTGPISSAYQSATEPLRGTEAKTLHFPRYEDWQQPAFQSILRQSLEGLGNTKFDFAPIEQQARRDFDQKTIPSIMDRFAAHNNQRSSSFRNALSGAGRELETDLAGLRGGYNLDQQRLLMDLLKLGLTPQKENVYVPREPGPAENIGVGVAQGVGKALPLLAAAAI